MARTRKSAPRLTNALAGVALAALSLSALSACGSDDTGARPETSGTPASQAAPTPSATSSAPAPAPTTKAPAPAKDAGDAKARPTRSTPATKPAAGATAPGGPVTCQGSNTKTVASALARPVDTMLLTVTNTGDHTCYLYGYPALRFTGAQAVPAAVPDSHPQAVVTLDPGESGYAAVKLSAADGSGGYGHTVHTLTVYFQGRSGTGSIGAGANPPLPAKGFYIDDTLRTTYWQQDLKDAVMW
jgi:hypothetical protein